MMIIQGYAQYRGIIVQKGKHNISILYFIPSRTYCGNPSYLGLPRNETETDIEDLYYGLNSFDNIFYAMLLIINTITIQGWSFTMYTVKMIILYSLILILPSLLMHIKKI